MDKTPEFLKNRIIWRAKQFTLAPQFTFLFEELPVDQQNIASVLAEKWGTGKPVIHFTKNEGNWTLVCTEGIISSCSNKTSKIHYTDIKSMEPEFLHSSQKGGPIDISTTKKSEWNELIIHDKAGNQFCLPTNSGQDHFALMNIILMMRNLLGW